MPLSRTIAFYSYRRLDDENSCGLITAIRIKLEQRLRIHYHNDVEIFQDTDDIKTGDRWQEKLNQALARSVFLIPVITPNFFQSEHCRIELESFFDKETELRRKDLVLPVLFVGWSGYSLQSNDPLISECASRLHTNWTAFNARMSVDDSLYGAIDTLARLIAQKAQEAPGAPISAIPSVSAANVSPPTSPQYGAPEVNFISRPKTPPNHIPTPEMVRISPGAFLMGSDQHEETTRPREHPRHTVYIGQTFEIGRYALTFDEFDAFCSDTGRSKPDDMGWGRGRRPAVNVSYEDAEAYCYWLNKHAGSGWRLPSEAEWEYCCRAGTTRDFTFVGPISADLVNYDAMALYREMTVEVGSLPPNPWGLHEMHGNVWEWCADCWNGNYQGAPVNNSAWLSGDCSSAVVRGGSWFDQPSGVRSANRHRVKRVIRCDNVGFRTARTVD